MTASTSTCFRQLAILSRSCTYVGSSPSQQLIAGTEHSVTLPQRKPQCARPSTMAILTRSFDSLRSYVGSFTWGPFVRLSRSAVLALLERIEIGQLVVRDSDGTLTICGSPGIKDGSPRTELKVLKETFWVRVMLFADMVSERSCFHGCPARCTIAETGRIDSRICRVSLKASCWVKSHVLISWRSSGYAFLPPSVVCCGHVLTKIDLHPQSFPAVKCHDLDIFPRFDPYQRSSEHKHSSQLPIERVSPLRH